MKAENENIERQRKNSRSAPGRSQHEDESPLPDSYYEDDRPSSAALSWRERLKPTITDDRPGSGSKQKKKAALPENLDQIVQKVLQLDTKYVIISYIIIIIL